jgi:uncharacterized membrane protein YidH (DUF202 family)
LPAATTVRIETVETVVESIGVIESEAGRVEPEEDKDSTGLLVAAVAMMVAMIGLFAFLMQKEKERGGRRRMTGVEGV